VLELGSPGFERGARSNTRPYRDSSASVQNEAPFVTHHPKKPLVSFLGVTHLGISFFISVFRGAWRVDNRSVDNRTCRNLDAALF